MSISFACGNCGKSFTVDDRFAGKKGQCKGCNAQMQIPEQTLRLETSGPRSSAPRRSTLEARSAGAARPQPPKPPQNLYDDDPAYEALPPRAPFYKSEDDYDRRFRGRGESSGPNRGIQVLGIVIGGLFLLGIAGSVLVELRKPGWNFANPLEETQTDRLMQQRLEILRREAKLLATVVDVPTALSASDQVNEELRATTRNLRELKALNPSQEELNRVPAGCVRAITAESLKIKSNLERIATIPGASQALNIFEAATELDQEVQATSGSNRINRPPPTNPATPPRFTPPPGFTPPPPPPPPFPDRPGNSNRPGMGGSGRPFGPGSRFGRPNH